MNSLSSPAQRIPFVFTYAPSYLAAARVAGSGGALTENRAILARLVRNVQGGRAWSHAVKRSLITLKALTFAPDRRHCRGCHDVASGEDRGDPQLGLSVLLGARRDAHSACPHGIRVFRTRQEHGATGWCVRRGQPGTTANHVRRRPASAGCGNGNCPGCDGYEGSKPVRIGNAAHAQLQLDVYGEMMDALYQARRVGLPDVETAWAVARRSLIIWKTCWREPDSGIWEMRGPPRHFTHSKMMAWVAFDRAIKSVEEFAAAGPDRSMARATRGRFMTMFAAMDSIRSSACFVQSYGRRRSMRACC